MRVIICGKGGSGKSTLTALLALEYASQGRRVLVVDTDESNTGLHRLLGVTTPKTLMDYLGGKGVVMQKMRAAMPKYESARLIEDGWSLDEFPEDYVTRQGGIRLAAIGKIHDFGEGCACPMGMLAKQTLSKLRLEPKDMVLIDTDAGIEHFGRGVEEGSDVIVMVLDPSYESLCLSEHVRRMAESLGIPLFYVLNRTDAVTGEQLRSSLAEPERIIGEIPQDAGILMAGLEGKSLSAGHPAAIAIAERLAAQESPA